MSSEQSSEVAFWRVDGYNSETSRCDQYRDLLETWAEWWNNVGRYHFTHYVTPPITATSEALGCTICSGLDDEMDGERCQVCGRRGR